jgi:hypothetical protein
LEDAEFAALAAWVEFGLDAVIVERLLAQFVTPTCGDCDRQQQAFQPYSRNRRLQARRSLITASNSDA